MFVFVDLKVGDEFRYGEYLSRVDGVESVVIVFDVECEDGMYFVLFWGWYYGWFNLVEYIDYRGRGEEGD